MSLVPVPRIPLAVIDQLLAVDPDQKVKVVMVICDGRTVTDYKVTATLTIKDKAGTVICTKPLDGATPLMAHDMDVKLVSSMWDRDGEHAYASTAQIQEAQFGFHHVVHFPPSAAAAAPTIDFEKSIEITVRICPYRVILSGCSVWGQHGATDIASVMQMYKLSPKFKQMMDICAARKVPLRITTPSGDMDVNGLFG